MKRWMGPALAAPATLWLLAAFAAPLAVVVLLALQGDSDPFAPLFGIPSLTQFSMIFEDDFYVSVVLKTMALACGVCLVTTLLAYPLALWIVTMPPRWRPLAMSGVLVPLLINVVVRSLGIELLLAPDGLINDVLALVGMPAARGLLYNYGAIAVGLVQVFLPFMVLALYDTLQAIPPRVLEAARSLGASRAAQFFSVELPMSLPGLKAGLTFVFLMASSTYVSARMLGGKKAFTTGMLVWQEVLENLNAQFAAALALIMTATALAASVAIALWIRRSTPWLRQRPARAVEIPAGVMRILDAIVPPLAVAGIVLAGILLLLPLLLVLVQSFNDVPQATMAGFRAFTFRWYTQLFQNGLYFDSFAISLELAAATAVVTVILASLAAFALVRGQFFGKTALEVFWMLPISLPQVAIGLGMLRLLQIFIAIPAFAGLLLVHVTVTLPFCIGLLRASVQQLEVAQEEAAGSLGAGPFARLWHVILPGLAPGLAAASIVAMLLSLEEVTITSFLTTARMTTLPVRIYAEASYSLEPTVYAISTLIIATTVAAMLALGKLVRLDRVFAR